MYSMTRAIPSLECWYDECPVHFSSNFRMVLLDLILDDGLPYLIQRLKTSLDNNASNHFLIHQYQYQYLLLLT